MTELQILQAIARAINKEKLLCYAEVEKDFDYEHHDVIKLYQDKLNKLPLKMQISLSDKWDCIKLTKFGFYNKNETRTYCLANPNDFDIKQIALDIGEINTDFLHKGTNLGTLFEALGKIT